MIKQDWQGLDIDKNYKVAHSYYSQDNTKGTKNITGRSFGVAR